MSPSAVRSATVVTEASGGGSLAGSTSGSFPSSTPEVQETPSPLAWGLAAPEEGSPTRLSQHWVPHEAGLLHHTHTAREGGQDRVR